LEVAVNPFANHTIEHVSFGDYSVWRLTKERIRGIELVKNLDAEGLAERYRKNRWDGCVEIIGTPDRFFIHGDWDVLNAVSDLGFPADLLFDPGLSHDYVGQKMTFQGPAFGGLTDELEVSALKAFVALREKLLENREVHVVAADVEKKKGTRKDPIH
jgi:hypothetical protein